MIEKLLEEIGGKCEVLEYGNQIIIVNEQGIPEYAIMKGDEENGQDDK